MGERTDWIYTAKGIGIILVILGHISFRPEWLNIWICSFHMPLFFFLSGITYNSEKYNDFGFLIRRKTKRLIIPYLLFAGVMWIWRVLQQCLNYVLGSGFDGKYLVQQLIGIVLQIRTTGYGIGIWFIPCIYCAFILLFVIIKLSRGKNLILLLLSSIALIAGYLYSSFINIKLPWGIDAAFVAVFFMTLGLLFKRSGAVKKMKGIKKDKIIIAFTVALALNIIFTFLNNMVLGRTVGMWSSNYGNIYYFVAEAICGIAVTVFFAHFISSSYVQDIGENSLFYYGIHVIIIEASAYFTGFIPGLENSFVAIACSILLTILTIVILKALNPIYKRIYNKIAPPSIVNPVKILS